jgi:hypothetical protein
VRTRSLAPGFLIAHARHVRSSAIGAFDALANGLAIAVLQAAVSVTWITAAAKVGASAASGALMLASGVEAATTLLRGVRISLALLRRR